MLWSSTFSNVSVKHYAVLLTLSMHPKQWIYQNTGYQIIIIPKYWLSNSEYIKQGCVAAFIDPRIEYLEFGNPINWICVQNLVYLTLIQVILCVV